jgi:hypothetical protein
MTEQPEPIDRHVAFDQFGKRVLRTTHDISAVLGEDEGGNDPVVLRTNGPHRSIGELQALIDEALEEDGPAHRE